MKHINFSRKTIVIASSFLVVVILCGTFYLGAVSSTNNTKNGGIVTYADLTPLERQRLEKQIELEEKLRDSDKNIADASVYLVASDNEITDVNIFIVSHEEITNNDELMLLVSESLNLDIKNIHIEFMDVETYTSLEKER